MSYNKNNRAQHDKKEVDEAVELENQFILRMPDEPARTLKEALRTGGTNLKDRFSIQLENDMRYGEVRVDHWLMHAKVVNLPTIVESLKTIDNKSFYKTADICQMMVCKEEPDIPSTDDESPSKNKKKDPNKVDKKFLWPHGITPPTKNVRRRRFRKTLKKKYVEAPEIEKEVKRLLREDNDAVSVRWEIISEDDDQMKQDISSGLTDEKDGAAGSKKSSKSTKSQQSSKMNTTRNDLSLPATSRAFGSPDESAPRMGLIEQDIFGGAVSDSEEEDTNINVDLDDNSRLSADDSTLNDSCSLQGTKNVEKLITSFSSEMFLASSSSSVDKKRDGNETQGYIPDPASTMEKSGPVQGSSYDPYSNHEKIKNMSDDMVKSRMEEVHEQLQELQSQRMKKQREVENMENAALRKRFEEMLRSLDEQIQLKKIEYENLQSMVTLY